MPASVPKYIKIKGVLKKNPAHPDNAPKPAAAGGADGPPPTYAEAEAKKQELVTVSTVGDIMEQNECAGAAPIAMAESTQGALEVLQDEMTVGKYGRAVDPGALVDGLSQIFEQYEIPIGMVNKLLELSTGEYTLVFYVDDSGSMGTGDSVDLKGKPCTRWQEVWHRLEAILQVVQFIPVTEVQVLFINRPDVVKLRHHGNTPATFFANAIAQIKPIFARGPSGGTRATPKMQQIIREADGRTTPTAVYFFFDGQLSDGTAGMTRLMLSRNARKIPVTFCSCTGDDDEVEWAKDLEDKTMPDGSPSYMAEIDDYKGEREEVLHDQGGALPFSKGTHLLCQLVAAINPTDLDALDEGPPLTRMTLANLMGRELSVEEYQHYFGLFMNNDRKTPAERQETQEAFGAAYHDFLRTDIEAHAIPAVQEYLRKKAGGGLPAGGAGAGWAPPASAAAGGMYPPQAAPKQRKWF